MIRYMGGRTSDQQVGIVPPYFGSCNLSIAILFALGRAWRPFIYSMVNMSDTSMHEPVEVQELWRRNLYAAIKNHVAAIPIKTQNPTTRSGMTQ